MQDAILQELQATGLLASWKQMARSEQDVAPLLGLSHVRTEIANGIAQRANGMEQPQGAQAGEQKLEIAPAQQQPEQAAEPQGMDIGEPPANEAADAAASAAQELLGQSRQVLIDITSNQNRPTQADSSTSAGRRGSRGGSDLQTNGSCQKASSAGNSNKGLRQFALLVCEQVREKGRTTYNEVADVLVSKLGETEGGSATKDVEKTIRRRVYDAINVLMATDIIQREKKEITWVGLPQGVKDLPCHSEQRPSSAPPSLGSVGATPMSVGSVGVNTGSGRDQRSETEALRQKRKQKLMDVDRKQQYLQDLIDQYGSLKQLIARNATVPKRPGASAIQVPFIVIQARPGATVQVDITDDLQNVSFNFHDSPIQIHDDSTIIRRLVQQFEHNRAQGAPAAGGAAGPGPFQRPARPARQVESCQTPMAGGAGSGGAAQSMQVSGAKYMTPQSAPVGATPAGGDVRMEDFHSR